MARPTARHNHTLTWYLSLHTLSNDQTGRAALDPNEDASREGKSFQVCASSLSVDFASSHVATTVRYLRVCIMLLAGTAAFILLNLIPETQAEPRCARRLQHCEEKFQQLQQVEQRTAAITPSSACADEKHLATLTHTRWQQTKAALHAASQALLQEEFGAATGNRSIALRIKLPGEESERQLRIELAPDALMPVTVLYFLRQIKAGLWDGAIFHRNAAHVLQASNQAPRARLGATVTSVSFQEYSPRLPHLPYTVGLAGRPGGPDWCVAPQCSEGSLTRCGSHLTAQRVVSMLQVHFHHR